MVVLVSHAVRLSVAGSAALTAATPTLLGISLRVSGMRRFVPSMSVTDE
jgi:hypothetical protein